MKEPIFIGAGTRGAKLVGGEFQPYMDFHGKTCLEHVVEAAMQTESIGDIFIWGDRKTLEKILADHLKDYNQRLVIVEERDNIVESFFFTFLNYVSRKNNTLRSMISSWDSIKHINWNQLKKCFYKTEHWEEQINVIVSDTPLISAFELDYLIKNKKKDVDLVVGRTVRRDYKNILERLNEFPDKEKSIKNFYTYRVDNKDIKLIVNSFMAGKPFKLNENLWNLIGNFYENRTIISGRKKNLRKIATNLLFFKRFFFPGQDEINGYSYAEKARAVLYLINAYKGIVKSKNTSTYYRDLDKIYKNINTLTGLTVEFSLSHCFGSAFDIDTGYEADFVRRNFTSLQNICSEYYKSHDGPEI